MRAFSLIELLVVVVIVGILAAVAIPAYNNYTTRTNVAESYFQIQNFAIALATKYQQNGSWPGSMTLGSAAVNINAGAFPIGADCTSSTPSASIISGTNLCQVSYETRTSFGSNTSLTSVMVQGSLSGFGSTNFIRVAAIVDKTKNQISYVCGTWGAAANNLPSRYLPSNCTCTVMEAYNSGSAVTSSPC